MRYFASIGKETRDDHYEATYTAADGSARTRGHSCAVAARRNGACADRAKPNGRGGRAPIRRGLPPERHVHPVLVSEDAARGTAPRAAADTAVSQSRQRQRLDV